MNVAIIPARGGSKRIPHKNIRPFNGKPIIAYSIEVALRSGLFDRVIVSTDDERIAEVARQNGAEIPFLRPDDLSDDFTGTNEVVKHSLLWLEKNGECVDYACCIYATAPLLQEKYLQQGYKRLKNSDKAFAFSATTFPFPIQRSIKMHGDGTTSPFYPDKIEMRSQDLEEAYHDAGQFYWGKGSAFMSSVKMFSGDSLLVVLPRHLVQDIDTMDDWLRAELMHQAYSARS